MSHTKEPWSFSEREDIRANGDTLPLLGISIPMTSGARQEEAKANARRIVACVNACRLIPTEWLEQNGAYAIPAPSMRDTIKERDTYRDLCGELIDELKSLLIDGCSILSQSDYNHYSNEITKAEQLLNGGE